MLDDLRLTQRIEVDANGCWIWKGRQTGNGYGCLEVRNPRKNWLAHRLVWTVLVGELTTHLHHACEVTLCVNPGHLIALTPTAHQRVHTETRTHCVHGHEFTSENTYVRKDTGARSCRACNNERTRNRKNQWSQERLEKVKRRNAEGRRKRTGARKLPGSRY